MKESRVELLRTTWREESFQYFESGGELCYLRSQGGGHVTTLNIVVADRILNKGSCESKSHFEYLVFICVSSPLIDGQHYLATAFQKPRHPLLFGTLPRVP